MGETAAHLTHKALTGIDIAIIAVYFVVIFAIGFYSGSCWQRDQPPAARAATAASPAP